jgi:hypothetical protein
VTILTATTMPGGDVTHPVPDNTGYITEGQFYLHDGAIDPFGSLSRLKQHVIGKVTREDHRQVMNAMIRFYSGAKDAQQKQAMAFELSALRPQAAALRRAVSGALHGHQCRACRWRRPWTSAGRPWPSASSPSRAADEAAADRSTSTSRQFERAPSSGGLPATARRSTTRR